MMKTEIRYGFKMYRPENLIIIELNQEYHEIGRINFYPTFTPIFINT